MPADRPERGAGRELVPNRRALTPESVVQVTRSVRGLGAHVETRCEVTGLAPGGVQTNRGDIATGTVVCAAARGRASGAIAGMHLPVEPVRRQIVFTEPIAGLPR